MTSSSKVVPLRKPSDRIGREEREFLPAALEIVETPPSPTGRATAYTIAALFCLALVWAWFGTIDIVASATGKIVPGGRSKVLQPFETGVVSAIHVHDGQSVRAGDILVELDTSLNEAERRRQQGDLVAAELEAARLTAALTAGADPLAAFRPPEGATAAQVAAQRQLLIQQIEEHRAKLAALDRQKTEKEAERATAAATEEKLEAILPILQERVDIRKTLFAHDTGSKANYLELYQTLTESQKDLAVQKSRSREADAAIAAIVEQRAQAEAEYRRTLSAEAVEAERKAAEFRQDVIKAEQKIELQRLRAPVDGTVQQLAVHTIGGVVTPAQSLLVLVPADSPIEIEAMLSNRDVGFVYVGQDAQIKVDTFNFTKYGLLHGKVMSVSQDAIARDRSRDPSAARTQGELDGSSEPAGQELVYAARISLDRAQMQVEDKLVNLAPGMAVTVEIETGSRRLIEYLLSPLLRYRQSAMRER
ncbi:MAG: HlyD family type I secretion periplasmic adaptor subunit [Roseiarcus sp.]|jgi:membrane fusion protein, hemolysin D